MSDDHENELRAKKQLDQKSFDRKARIHKKLDWEPLKLLIDLIGDDTFDDIGGPPQLMKVYKHANTLPINVLWSGAKDCNGLRRPTFEITHLGRALLDYERNRYLTLDIETWEFLEPWKIRERLKVYREREKSQLKQSLRQTICLAIAGLRNKRDLQHRLTLMVANDCKNDEIFREITNYRFVENTV